MPEATDDVKRSDFLQTLHDADLDTLVLGPENEDSRTDGVLCSASAIISLVLNHVRVLEEREQLRIQHNETLSQRQRVQFHLEEMISVTAGGSTNTDISDGARIWRVRSEALAALKGLSWQHDFYYAALDKANAARALLKRVKADRPSAHSEAVWADINAFLET